jgi:hypothetical protein
MTKIFRMSSPAAPAKTTPPSRLWLRWGLGLIFLAGTALAFWPFYAASREVQRLCDSLAPGMSVTDAREKVEALGYVLEALPDGKAAIHDPGNWENMSCKLRFGEQGLLAGK